MKFLWLGAALALSVAAVSAPASAGGVNGIPNPVTHCWPHKWHGRWVRCPRHPIGRVIGHPIGRVVTGHTVGIVNGRPVEGIATHGIGTTHGVVTHQTHGVLVNGIPAEQRVQH
ncbi:MAG TPA: hypothetical protein VGI95_09585 [Caulobacteraceae bacterium]|jgi:hypothetical protein